ncbi:reticulophagy regulator 3-like [Clavelina lepadiformis]|uniref:RETREG1-3/ARL6IP-like N-terminal reticulon-homology domain-containing protein n=1 Tax=Clavelina lepadiformis TaxID=159417 RepID=A0ABP0FGR5_CLALP
MASPSGAGDASLSSSSFTFSQALFNQLKHYESLILSLQRLLVWEKPAQSAFFVFVVHVVFWYIFINSHHAFGFVFSLVLFLLLIDLWKHKIWPEIRAESPDAEAEWGELNPNLLCLREMCEVAAKVVISISSTINDILAVRSMYPGKFCLCFNGACLVLIVLGNKIPGVILAYFTMLCMLLWPVLWYHRLLERTYLLVEPFLMQLQYTLKQRPSEAYLLTKYVADQKDTEIQNGVDDDLSDFVPTLDEKTTAVLARAITDDSELSETDEEILANELPSFSRSSTPDGLLSKEFCPASLQHQQLQNIDNHSDDDDDHFGLLSTVLNLKKPEDTSENIMVSTNQPEASQCVDNPLNNLIKGAIEGVVRDTFTSLAQSVKPPFRDLGEQSSSSTPTSDYEFVILSSEDEDNI